MSRLFLTGVITAATLTLATPAPATPMTYEKLTYLTFSAPVQVPGATLQAGTYRFWLTNPATSRNVLQVLSGDGAVVYAMFHTIPDGRAVLTDESTVTFRETPVGVPAAVKSLFYGGEYHGYEFVYGENEPIMIAPSPWPLQPPPTFAPAATPEAVIEPAVEPVAVPEPAPEPVEEIAVTEEPLVQPAAEELPKTATVLPLVGVGGVAGIVLGLGLALVRRRFT